MILTIANSKGGSGKSTIALNLAIALGLDKKDVLVIDTDEQRSIEKFSNIRSTMLEQLNNNIESAKQYQSNFTCISRNGNALSDTIKQMAKKYEIVIIDTKASISTEQRKSMLLSDYVLIPTTASQIDVSELLMMFEYISDIKDFNPNLKVFIVLNRISPNPFLSNESLELKQFIDEFKSDNKLDDIHILDSIIHDRIDYKRSITKGLGVCELDLNNKCHIEFSNLLNELQEKMKY